MTPARGLLLICKLAAFIALLNSALVLGDVADSIVQQVDGEVLRELFLPVFVAVPSGKASGREAVSSRREIAPKLESLTRSYSASWPRTFFGKAPGLLQKLDIGRGTHNPSGRSSVVLPGAIIVDPRHGILLPQGHSREELEPTIRESFRVMDRYLHRNESKLKIIRRRRSVETPPPLPRDRIRAIWQRQYASENLQRGIHRPFRHRIGNTPRSTPFPRRRSPRTGLQGRRRPDRFRRRSSPADVPETQTPHMPSGTPQDTTPSPIETLQESSTEVRMVLSPGVNPELRKFLLEGTVNNTPSDVLVLKEAVNTSSLRPFELVRLNATNASDPYEGTPLSTLGKYWLLPPGFKARRRRRRALEPYYAVSSFVLSPTYTRDQNQTYYTVFFRVTDGLLDDFAVRDGQQGHGDQDDGKHLYSEELFKFVTENREGHRDEHQDEERGKLFREQGLEEMFHNVYENMKKDDERRYGTVEPPHKHQVAYSSHHEELPNGTNQTKSSDAHDAVLKGPVVKRHEASEIDVASTSPDLPATRADDVHTHQPEPITGVPGNLPHTEASALVGPGIVEEGVAPEQTVLEDDTPQPTPVVAQKLAEQQPGYNIQPEEPQKQELQRTAELKGEANTENVLDVPPGKRTVSVNGVPYVLVREDKDNIKTKTGDGALLDRGENDAQVAKLLSSNAFANMGMVYRPLNGQKVDSDILNLLRPEALIVPDPDKIQHDRLLEYPLAVVYRVPKQQQDRSPTLQSPGDSVKLRPPIHQDSAPRRSPDQDGSRLWQMTGKKGSPSSTTKDNIKCIYRKNSVVCYETRR